jgi:hypothetical protein
MFENRMLRGIFGPKRDEVTRWWRNLHNEELHYLYFLPSTSIIRMESWRTKGAALVARMGSQATFLGNLSSPFSGSMNGPKKYHLEWGNNQSDISS